MSTLNLNYLGKKCLTHHNDVRYVYASSSSGMCDRLSCLIGSKRIAKELNRQFAYYWPVNDNCGCKLTDLFECDWEPIGDDHIYNLLHTQAKIAIYDVDNPLVNPAEGRHTILIKCWVFPQLTGDSVDRLKELVRPFAQELKPVAETTSHDRLYGPSRQYNRTTH